ncbi:MAG: cobalt ECF transporter T component CbiQ [Aminobacterium sp.]|jgi:cobalt/nickel transport system permease protein|nr:cobalt ECF transporter T component CbiQ [Aminobacterium sp.]MDD3425839.1 cobalt ECF transporter T component CbiQ [Aminobacterium sp.]MDD3708512.1 cobalt ECF transporter T component CbiQ [Aminobacterium sp.]MDD4228366.1 cobalt ECF transporter T component CbiQ [Aminobacterium sp.]
MGNSNFPSLNYQIDIPEGFLNRIPASIKVVLVFLFALCVAFLQSVAAQLFLLVYAIMLVAIARIPIKVLSSRLLALNGFILMMWLTLPFSSESGTHLALLITIRAHAATLAFIALLRTTSMPDLLQALHLLHVPQKLILLLHFTYRYAHVLSEELQKIHKSMVLRGFHPSLSFTTFSAYGNLVGMLLIRSIIRSERVSKAMVLRGFNGSFPFFPSHVIPSSPDTLRMAALYVLLAGCFIV